MARRLVRPVLRLAFQLLYHQLSWSYDLIAWLVSGGQWRAWTRATLPYLVGPRVLEIGFGPGHLLVTMAGEGLRPVGVDRSPQMLRLARRNLHGQRVPLLRGDGLALPFRAGAFDSVVLTFPAPYVRHAGAEIRRVLAPGG